MASPETRERPKIVVLGGINMDVVATVQRMPEPGETVHGDGFFMAGGGIQPGISYGETDDYGYNITKDPVDVHDLHATILHLLGVEHTKLTFKYQGRHFRLTDVHGNVVKPLLT